LPVAVLLFSWMLGKRRPPTKLLLRRVIAPISLVLAFTMAAIGYYCWRVTGKVTRMPYQVEMQTYVVAPYFLWQSMKPVPTYHHAEIRDMYVNREPQMYEFSRSFLGLVAKAYRGWSFYLWPVLSLPLLMLLVVLPYGFSLCDISRRAFSLLFIFAMLCAGLALETFFEPHYASPITGVIVAFVMLAMSRLRSWRFQGRRTGIFLVRAVLAICVIMFFLRAAAGPLHIYLSDPYAPAWHQAGPRFAGRTAVLRDLEKLPGRQLVIVRYRPGHDPFEEWVYNRASIDEAQVVWAREMGASDDGLLVAYFKDRNAWLLEADEKPPRLSPYPARK